MWCGVKYGEYDRRSAIKAIIGGTASSGSSLLVQILNRHSKIYCGPETNLFTSRALRENWSDVKKKLISNDITLDGWHLHHGVQLEHLLERSRLLNLIDLSTSYSSFINEVVSEILDKSNKTYFIEKAPSNAVHFLELNELFPEAHMILTIRNPLDCIASMMARGWNATYAAGLYLYNLSIAASGEIEHSVIRYEDLIEQPFESLLKLLQKLDLEWEPDIVRAGLGTVGMSEWRSAEDGQIEKNESRFENLKSDKQQEILYAIHKLEFSSEFITKGIQPRFANIKEIAEFYDYKIPELHPNQMFLGLRVKLWFEILYQKCMRSFRSFNHGIFDFPFHLRK